MQEKKLEIAGGSLCYKIEDNRVIITQCQGEVAELILPETIEGLPVTALDKKSFLGKRRLAKVFLPDTVESIGDYCFAGDGALRFVSLPGKAVAMGKSPFRNCANLKQLEVREASGGKVPAALFALAAVEFDSAYLLNTEEAGSDEWFRKWDARLLMELNTPDMEGHTNAVLCGEEDYESTNLEGFLRAKRMRKSRYCLLRLANPDKLEASFREELENYLRNHTRGTGSDEAWQVILQEFPESREYYSLFAELGGVTAENLEGILEDIGGEYPEMKAYFLRIQTDKPRVDDFFAGLEL